METEVRHGDITFGLSLDGRVDPGGNLFRQTCRPPWKVLFRLLVEQPYDGELSGPGMVALLD